LHADDEADTIFTKSTNRFPVESVREYQHFVAEALTAAPLLSYSSAYVPTVLFWAP